MFSRKLLPLMYLTTAASGLASNPALAGSANNTPEAVARHYLAAEKSFDRAALADAIVPQFVEISPRGEIDEHDRVLSFYTPDKKVDPPPLTLGEFKTRASGSTAVVTTTISYAVPGPTMTFAVGMTATKTSGGWKLVSAQYTATKPKPSK